MSDWRSQYPLRCISAVHSPALSSVLETHTYWAARLLPCGFSLRHPGSGTPSATGDHWHVPSAWPPEQWDAHAALGAASSERPIRSGPFVSLLAEDSRRIGNAA